MAKGDGRRRKADDPPKRKRSRKDEEPQDEPVEDEEPVENESQDQEPEEDEEAAQVEQEVEQAFEGDQGPEPLDEPTLGIFVRPSVIELEVPRDGNEAEVLHQIADLMENLPEAD